MEFLVIFISLSYCLSMLLPKPCVAMHIHNQQGNVDEIQFPPSVLPRKLKLLLNEKVFVHGHEGHHHQSSISNDKQKEDALGKAQNKEQNLIIHGNRGTRHEWMEELGADTSQYFTMDYSLVKRRTPIHNKGLPVGP